MNWLLLLLAISIPNCAVRAGYRDSVAKLELVIEAEPCDYAGWTGPDKRIHICATPGMNVAWIASHEMTHILAGHSLPRGTDWDAFSRKAIEALRREPYTYAQLSQAKYMATWGGHELHAELPWIVEGEIPDSLARYYPWLEPMVEVKNK